MAKTNKDLNLKKTVLKLLTKQGFMPDFIKEGNDEQIDCIIDGTSFSMFYDVENTFIGYSVIFEPNDPVSDEQYKKLNQIFEKENLPFDNLMQDEFDCIQLYGEIDSKDYSDKLVEDIVKCIKKPTGIVAELKKISFLWK